jgi:hypothetical protein
MTIIPIIPASARSSTKKALLIGIGYHKREGESDFIPTSTPNVKQLATFLRGERYLPPRLPLTHTTTSRLLEHCGYTDTDIVLMTDEEGVEERYQPTEANLVRPSLTLALDPHILTVPSIRYAK